MFTHLQDYYEQRQKIRIKRIFSDRSVGNIRQSLYYIPFRAAKSFIVAPRFPRERRKSLSNPWRVFQRANFASARDTSHASLARIYLYNYLVRSIFSTEIFLRPYYPSGEALLISPKINFSRETSYHGYGRNVASAGPKAKSRCSETLRSSPDVLPSGREAAS